MIKGILETLGLIVLLVLLIGGAVLLQVLVLQFVWNYLVDYFHFNIRPLDTITSFALLVLVWTIGGAFKSSSKK